MLASSTESCAWVTKQLFVLMLSGHILSVTSSHDKCLGSFLSIYVRSKLVQRGCTNALCTINIVWIYHIYQVSLISSRLSSHQTGQGIQSTETIIHKEIKMMLWELFLHIPMITALCIKMTTSNNRHSEHTPQSPTPPVFSAQSSVYCENNAGFQLDCDCKKNLINLFVEFICDPLFLF